MKKKYNIGIIASAFDVFHPGHAMMLKEAKSICKYLIACIQIDPSKERSEKHKPIQGIVERQIILKSIKYVDEIIIYETEKDLYGILKTLKPDVRIMGTDWKYKKFTGSDLNIPVEWHDRFVHTYSTTNLRERIWIAENEVRKIDNNNS